MLHQPSPNNSISGPWIKPVQTSRFLCITMDFDSNQTCRSWARPTPATGRDGFSQVLTEQARRHSFEQDLRSRLEKNPCTGQHPQADADADVRGAARNGVRIGTDPLGAGLKQPTDARIYPHNEHSTALWCAHRTCIVLHAWGSLGDGAVRRDCDPQSSNADDGHGDLQLHAVRRSSKIAQAMLCISVHGRRCRPADAGGHYPCGAGRQLFRRADNLARPPRRNCYTTTASCVKSTHDNRFHGD